MSGQTRSYQLYLQRKKQKTVENLKKRAVYRKIRSKYNQQYQDNAGGVGLPTLARDSEDEEDSEEEEEGQRARPVNAAADEEEDEEEEEKEEDTAIRPPVQHGRKWLKRPPPFSQEYKDRKEAAAREKAAAAEAARAQKAVKLEKRAQLRKLLTKRTSRGQPVMKARSLLLLDKVKKLVGAT